MYSNIIFDLGNVLLDFHPKNYYQDKLDPITLEAILEMIFHSPEWLMLDRGTLTEPEVIDILCKRHPNYASAIHLAFKDWYDILQPITKHLPLLPKLKEKGAKLYFLSNFHHLAFEKMNERYDFFTLFDGGIVSYQVNLLKPEPAIYTTLLQTYHLDASTCLFIDDTLANVEAAESLGIKSIWLQPHVHLEKSLASFHIL